MNQVARQPRPLGHGGQQPMLELRRQTRAQALVLHRWAAAHGISLRRVAARIGVAEQTISHWSTLRTIGRLDAAPRGRPRHTLTADVKAQVQELLHECRGRLGLPLLKAAFVDVPRTTLRELLQVYRSEHDGSMEHLTWTRPGRVWAADFTEADAAIEGSYRYVLSVRDLASYQQILSLPVRRADACATICALVYLFSAHGAPLVLKTDNGSAFIDHRTRSVLSAERVTHLLSPPKTPRYNGAKEAGIASLKTRTLHIAAAHGRPAHWTCDDVEAARIEANLQSRPWGRNGLAPIDVWEKRSGIADDERRQFLAVLAVAAPIEERKMKEQKQVRPGSRPASAAADAAAQSLNANERAAVVRRAIRRVLIEPDYLCVRRVAN